VKISKELIVGIVTLAAIGLLVAGVNFLKGNSFFGGDDVYYAYFANSAGVTPSNSIYYNGVIVGKITDVELTGSSDPNKAVKITFNIQDDEFKIPKNMDLQAGGAENDLLGKGIIIQPTTDSTRMTLQGFYKPGDKIQGVVAESITSQVEAQIGPIRDNINFVLGNLDDFSKKLAAFWDTTAQSEMEQSMREVKLAIRKFGDAADMINSLVAEEKGKVSRIMTNVQEITMNLKKSNDTVKAIVGNVKTITDDLVTSDFKGTIENAKNTLASVNKVLDEALTGEGTIGKLISDDSLYMELIQTNQELQNLVEDLQKHPERYIHFSVLGAKSRRQFTEAEEKKIRKEVIDTGN
jgi:phospholipid/cholesterol/gamma-HCH transport system substrate-binding protein